MRGCRFRNLVFLLGSVLFAGCATSRVHDSDSDNKVNASLGSSIHASDSSDSITNPLSTPMEKRNRVAPGNLVRLSQFEDERLNRNFRIDFDGRLYLPYDVTIQTHNLTVEELRTQVGTAFKRFFRSSIQIGVDRVNKSLWIEIRGLIKKPGRFLVKETSTIEEIIAMAGGTSGDVGEVKFVKIMQGRDVKAISLDRYYGRAELNPGLTWKGGDVLFFQHDLESEEGLTEALVHNQTIQLLGEVRKPGEIAFKADSDFYYYLARAGGPTSAADATKVVLIRGKDYSRKSFQFSAEDMKELPKVEEGDTLIVSADHVSMFQKALQATVSIVTMITSVAFLIVVL